VIGRNAGEHCSLTITLALPFVNEHFPNNKLPYSLVIPLNSLHDKPECIIQQLPVLNSYFFLNQALLYMVNITNSSVIV